MLVYQRVNHLRSGVRLRFETRDLKALQARFVSVQCGPKQSLHGFHKFVTRIDYAWERIQIFFSMVKGCKKHVLFMCNSI
jgi:hypothetical protein